MSRTSHDSEAVGTVEGTVVPLLVTALVGLVGLVGAWYAFVSYPESLSELLGVLMVTVVTLVALWLGSRLGGSFVTPYNVAEVAVEGPIARESKSGVPGSPIGLSADDVVEQIEQADADPNVDALLVKLNTPGGEIVPSADIRLAAESFDGPTVGYATDVCASGGYDIAVGCDEFWAREGTLVGSIGVIGSRVNAHDLAERLGLSYEGFTAGDYKDAGAPLKELDPREREYLQGLVDDYYDQFVDTVAEGRDLDRDAVEDTEARVFLGTDALERDLVDELGTREDVEDALAERLDESVVVREFEPVRSLRDRVQIGAERATYAFGSGLASAFDGDADAAGLRFRR
ncbi:signal peptide peptidase SppA [Halosimplex salinum]|uniref:signal peptide peptidase SppA n=1 Tax=Halosimplex salinum TaxID=1710538 RepID=UPI0013DDAFCA|nr:signal peptide peptidase SppA [Halosimplex salinum]